MAESDGLDDVARQLRLDAGEMLVVGVMQYAMLGHGVAEEKSVETRQAKTRVHEEFASSVVAHLFAAVGCRWVGARFLGLSCVAESIPATEDA